MRRCTTGSSQRRRGPSPRSFPSPAWCPVRIPDPVLLQIPVVFTRPSLRVWNVHPFDTPDCEGLEHHRVRGQVRIPTCCIVGIDNSTFVRHKCRCELVDIHKLAGEFDLGIVFELLCVHRVLLLAALDILAVKIWQLPQARCLSESCRHDY